MRSDCKHLLRNIAINEGDKEYGAERQLAYEDGAVLYNFSRRTREGMVGGIFDKPPEIELPTQLEYLLKDADGNGIGIIQQSRDAVQENIEISRLGLLVDMPGTAGMSRADQNKGLINPKILIYTAESIINWRMIRVGAINKLKWIVLLEEYEYESGGEFQVEIGKQYRLLELNDDGQYQQRIWRYDVSDVEVANAVGDTDYQNGDIIEIKQNGKPLDHIPFFFIGGQNNDHTIDEPIMEPICELNVGHYRNSADNEESSFIVGQPTLFIAPGENINADTWRELNPDGVKFGSRRGHNIGAGGNAFLIQADPNSIAKENMADKENQALKIGAQLISSTANVTAESARIQRGADNSILATAALNVSIAYKMAICECARFLGLSEDKIKFALNTDYFDNIMTYQDRAQWLAEINFGAMPMSDYWEAMRKSGLTKKTNEELETEIATQPVITMEDNDIESSETEDNESEE